MNETKQTTANTTLEHAIQRALENGLRYEAYLEMTDALLAENKTTGENQSPEMVEYTRLNRQRMSRVEKTFSLTDELKKILDSHTRPITFLLISEPWCGDASASVPAIAKIADSAANISLLIALRDQHLDLMDLFLTNGGRAIPKLVILDSKTQQVLGVWGPRPYPAQQMVMEHKANPQEPYSEFVKKVQLWYAHDRSLTIQKEIGELIQAIE